MQSVRKLIESYEKWVAANPETVSDVETTTKWVSYFIAGRISDSNVVSELIYSLSNMLVLYNDRILDKAKHLRNGMLNAGNAINNNNNNLKQKTMNASYRLKVMLTTLEYSEVFIEISAKRLFGNKGKWLLITLIQVVKAIGRYFILKHSTEHIITSPAMPSINRREYVKEQKNGRHAAPATANKTITPEQANFTFQLKRSGRVLRKVEGAPPLQYRDFKLHANLAQQSSDTAAAVPRQLMRAEYLYIAKPLIHLAAMGVFGGKRWKPYAIAFAVDVLSIRMYYQQRHLMTKAQKLELSRRCIQLLLYLLRSPFYERHSQQRINRLLDFFANYIPFAKMLAAPIKEYIPHYQSTYFYMWST